MILFYLGWSGSVLQIRTNIIKVGSKSWLLTCNSNIFVATLNSFWTIVLIVIISYTAMPNWVKQRANAGKSCDEKRVILQSLLVLTITGFPLLLGETVISSNACRKRQVTTTIRCKQHQLLVLIQLYCKNQCLYHICH